MPTCGQLLLGSYTASTATPAGTSSWRLFHAWSCCWRATTKPAANARQVPTPPVELLPVHVQVHRQRQSKSPRMPRSACMVPAPVHQAPGPKDEAPARPCFHTSSSPCRPCLDTVQDPSGVMLPRLLQLGAVSQPGMKHAWQVPPLLSAWLRHFPAMRQFLCNKALASHLELAFSQPCQPPADCMVRALCCAVQSLCQHACIYAQCCG